MGDEWVVVVAAVVVVVSVFQRVTAEWGIGERAAGKNDR